MAGRGDPASYVSTEGHVVDRVEADRVFRDAMADTGTGVVRRWIVWTAVTVATIFVGRVVPWTPARQWSYRVAAALTIAAIVYLGDQLGVGGQLSTGVIVVLGIRIFSNVAAIRRHLFHA